MTFPDIKQRQPDCDISLNAQVTAANFKAKKYSIKEGWQKLSLETLGSVSGWENMSPKKTWLYFYTFSSHQRKTLWNLKGIFTFQLTHQFLKQRCKPMLNFIGCLTDFQKGSNSKLISTEHFSTSLLASSLLYSKDFPHGWGKALYYLKQGKPAHWKTLVWGYMYMAQLSVMQRYWKPPWIILLDYGNHYSCINTGLHPGLCCLLLSWAY